jgi:biotin carboxylase
MNNNDQWVWMIAGGIMQVPMIEEIKGRGYKIIVSDRDPEAPGCQLADQVIELDVYDVDGHLSVAEAMGEKPVAVLTAGSDSGVTVSAVAEILNVPAVGASVAARTKHKINARTIMGNSHPVYTPILHDEPSPNSVWKRLCQTYNVDPYPCVVKPPDKSGSRGVFLIDTPMKWGRAMEIASRSTNSRWLLVEQYLDGEEIATDFLVHRGRIYFLNAARRIFHEFGIEAGHINPYELPDRALVIAKKAIKKLGITEGPIKIDMINDRRYGWTVTEAATRLSGGFDHMYTAPLSTGKNITGVMLDYALGENLDKRKLKRKFDKYAFAYSPIYEPGLIRGWKKTPKMKGLRHTFILENNRIEPMDDCTKRPVFIITVGDTELDAMKNAIKVSRRLEPVYVT